MENASLRHIPMFTRIHARQNSTNSEPASVKLYAVVDPSCYHTITYTYLLVKTEVVTCCAIEYPSHSRSLFTPVL
jgi:hypothetical protein